MLSDILDAYWFYFNNEGVSATALASLTTIGTGMVAALIICPAFGWAAGLPSPWASRRARRRTPGC